MQSYMQFNYRLRKDFVEACRPQCQALSEAVAIYLFIKYTSNLHFEMEGKIGNQKAVSKDLFVSWTKLKGSYHCSLLGANEPDISQHSVLEPIMKMPVIRLGVSLVGEKRPLYLLTLWRILASHNRWLAYAPDLHFWQMKLSVRYLIRV